MKTCPICDSDYPGLHSTCPSDGAVLILSHELEPGSLVRGKYRITSKQGQGGMAMVAGSWGVAPAGLADMNLWVGGHTYSVLDFDEAAQTVSLRNPWGDHPGPDGFFTIPLATFFEAFESCSFSDSPTP